MKLEQPKIRITDIHGQDFGEKYVTQITWDILGFPSLIKVEFACDSGNMPMYYQHDTDTYLNEHENLIGKII